MESNLKNIFPAAMLEKLLGLALSKGGDFAELYMEQSATNQMALEESKIRTATHGIALGLGVRVIAGTEVGYAYTDDLDSRALEQTALTAAAIAAAGGGERAGPVAINERATPNRYPFAPSEAPTATPPADKRALLLRADQAARRHDARILQVSGALIDQTKEIVVVTSDGDLTTDRQLMCRMAIQAIGQDSGGDRRTGFHGAGGRVTMGHFGDVTPESIGEEAARMAIAQLGAVDVPAGPQTVVLSPGWSGILLHEAVGHGLEADFIRKGTSLYAGKLGEQVASPLCTVIDNGELPHRRGTLNIDDEGENAQEKVLIENGILKNYMVDRLSSRIMSVPSTGSGRRESYQHAPMPRMTNTYMAAGAHTHEEILTSVDKGLYCASFGGGQVDIANGNFVFEVREGYIIENGRLGAPVKNAMLIGVGPDALKNVAMVGDNPELDPGLGTCGKDGQSVPVGVGLPTVRIDNLTVGGTHVQ